MDRASARNEHYLELLKDLRLMDDDFFSEALDEKIEPVEYILCTILEREDIKVQHTEAQVEYKSATKRSIKLDIRAVDADGRLMHDMNCTDPSEMLNPLLAKEVRYLKETEGGKMQMCRAFEEVARESAKEAEEKARIETKREMVRKLYALGQMSLETIAECTDEVKALVEKKPA